MLRIRYIRPSGITSELCRKLWDLRLRNIRLRPDVNPEDDYRSFEKYFTDGTTAVTFWDSAGELQGFYGWNQKRLRIEEQDFLRVVAEYVFMNPEYRGGPEFAFSGIPLATPLLFKYPRASKVIVGVGYPATYISCKLSAPRVVTLQSPAITSGERKLLEDFAAEQGGDGFDRASGVVRMRTVPIVPRQSSSREAVRAALAEYEAQNPRWKEGYGLPTLVDVSWAALGTALKRALSSALN
jgi:hypothetical protein